MHVTANRRKQEAGEMTLKMKNDPDSTGAGREGVSQLHKSPRLIKLI